MEKKFDTTQADRGAPSEADLKRIAEAKSHREAYPEQYEHPRVGEQVIVMNGGAEVARGTIKRVVGSTFGQMAQLENGDTGQFYLLSACVKS